MQTHTEFSVVDEQWADRVGVERQDRAGALGVAFKHHA